MANLLLEKLNVFMNNKNSDFESNIQVLTDIYNNNFIDKAQFKEDRLMVKRVDEQHCLLENDRVSLPVKCSDKLEAYVADYNQYPHGPSSMSALNMATPLVSKIIK